MKNTSRFRRAAGLLAWGLVSGAYACDEAPQSLEAVRKAADQFVRAQIPGEPDTVRIAVGALDESLRLARCPQPLQVSLPVGGAFRESITVVVSCPGGEGWTVNVPVSIATAIKTRYATLHGARIAAVDVGALTKTLPWLSASHPWYSQAA